MLNAREVNLHAFNRGFPMATEDLVRQLRQEDRRADGAVREVRLEARRILISRRYLGIDMQVGVPVGAYRGIVLSLAADAQGLPAYRLSLCHLDEDLSVELMRSGDDAEVVAEWRFWASYFNVPKFIEREPGVLESPDLRLGRVCLGRARPQRRRNATMSRRRPRILSRRKPGRKGATGAVHRDERVIIIPYE